MPTCIGSMLDDRKKKAQGARRGTLAGHGPKKETLAAEDAPSWPRLCREEQRNTTEGEERGGGERRAGKVRKGAIALCKQRLARATAINACSAGNTTAGPWLRRELLAAQKPLTPGAVGTGSMGQSKLTVNADVLGTADWARPRWRCAVPLAT